MHLLEHVLLLNHSIRRYEDLHPYVFNHVLILLEHTFLVALTASYSPSLEIINHLEELKDTD